MQLLAVTWRHTVKMSLTSLISWHGRRQMNVIISYRSSTLTTKSFPSELQRVISIYDTLISASNGVTSYGAWDMCPVESARLWLRLSCLNIIVLVQLKPGFHYPSWRLELTARVDWWPVSITRQRDGPSTRLVETRARQHGPCWRVMETDQWSPVNSGRQLG